MGGRYCRGWERRDRSDKGRFLRCWGRLRSRAQKREFKMERNLKPRCGKTIWTYCPSTMSVDEGTGLSPGCAWMRVRCTWPTGGTKMSEPRWRNFQAEEADWGQVGNQTHLRIHPRAHHLSLQVTSLHCVLLRPRLCWALRIQG